MALEGGLSVEETEWVTGFSKINGRKEERTLTM
jgi:hypothetical protein